MITLSFRFVSAPDQKPFPFRLDFPPDLPISECVGEIVDTLREHQVLILAGETGSGKTTQIPKMCVAAGRGELGRIACTQPRRVAALSVSRRVAEELGVEWGGPVGCKVRFSDQTSRDTVVKFMTDGMLLAEVQGDPQLRDYDTIIIDEAHERSLNIDFLLGHLRLLRHRRPDLKIVITSATIDTDAFSRAFDDAPVIEVSGRTFPVEVVYAPLDELGTDEAEGDEPAARSEALHYIDGAVEAVERILTTTDHGDVLVFMPAERDIREAIDLLDGRTRGCDFVPLFGRLSNAEQQRVFATSSRRRVIVATNIAETSLTLPGIRYVVDTGLARVSRYVPQGRTRRLPIEAVSRSSADQRKGRAGRVAAGVCVRLYSEKDYNERPRFTQPEIQRSNLADVILRLKAFGLGDVERFPFINMPATKSVRAGYALLEELHAVERGGGTPGEIQLTAIGRELARLPVDPTVGRMILQARTEKAVREVLVIASGLSIQDPRERPLEKQVAADAAHRKFAHPDSDFLTLLNIWERLHDEFERLSQSKMRRWCRDHFLSYTRMREWRDIHHQLADTFRGRDGVRLSSVWDGGKIQPTDREAANALRFGQPAYRAIHRSILTGLLSNIATLHEESGGYHATHSRKVAIFPGSVLFARESRKREGGAKPATIRKSGVPRGPRWLMAAEVMETTRLYARTCARFDPGWAGELGAHLVKTSHSEPFWDEEKGRVMVRQRTRLHGLEIDVRAVGYGRVDPEHATELFIREGLVNDTIKWPFDFLLHNRKVRVEVENQMTRMRDRGFMNLEERIFAFYAERLLTQPEWLPVSAVGELTALVKERKPHEPRFLQFTADDLREKEQAVADADAFPVEVALDNSVLPLNYVYKPGADEDGVTLEVDVQAATELDEAALDWAVPGHLAGKVEHYLRGLPKDLRVAVMPLAQTAQRMTADLRVRHRSSSGRESLKQALAALLGERFRLRIAPGVWDDRPLPLHLQVRVSVCNRRGEVLCASRDLSEVKQQVAQYAEEKSRKVAQEAPGLWKRARAKWESEPLSEWSCGDLPDTAVIGHKGGAPITAYPILRATADGVVVRLARTREEADREGPSGLRAMLKQALRYELAWLEKDLRALRQVGALASTLTSIEALQADALVGLEDWLTDPSRLPLAEACRTRKQFENAVGRAKSEIRGLVPRLVDRLKEILELRQDLMVAQDPPEGMDRDLAEILPPDLLRTVPYPQLSHLPRYLRAMMLRVQRWRQNPGKDAERAAEIAPFAKAYRELRNRPGGNRLRWLIEEYRVSVFAQKLGTTEPVSRKKLEAVVASLRSGEMASTAQNPAVPTGTKAKPLAVTPLPGKTKAKPLKSLNALGGLFGHK